MTALRLPVAGAPRVMETEIPACRPGDVLVKVAYSALNRLDLLVAHGDVPARPPITLGSDASGWVHDPGTSDLPAGAPVAVNPVLGKGEILGVSRDGTHAEYVAVPRENVMALPPDVDLRAVAAVPLAWQTAYRLVHGRLGVRPSDTVLIPSASGGVADACVALCSRIGATVIAATRSADKLPLLRTGPSIVTVHDEADGLEAAVNDLSGGRGVDCLVEHVGGAGWSRNLTLVRQGGRVGVCGATDDPNPPASLSEIWWRELTVVGSSLGTPEDFRAVVEAVKDGHVAPTFDMTFAPAEAVAALSRLAAGAAIGKVLIKHA